MLYQEDNKDLDGDCLTDDERLACFSIDRERILGRVKGLETPYVKGTQYY